MGIYIWRDPYLRERVKALMDARYEIRVRLSWPGLEVDPNLEKVVEGVFAEMIEDIRGKDKKRWTKEREEEALKTVPEGTFEY